MVSAGNVDMLSRNDSLRGFDCSLEDNLQSELELLLRAQHNQQALDRETELNICRSGSAPPTVEGSHRAIGGFLAKSGGLRDGGSNVNGNNTWEFANEDDIRSHPADSSYYYSRENFNPRLPPPLMSKEDWRVSQRFQVGGSSFGGVRDLGDNSLAKDLNDSSLFSTQPGVPGLSVQDATNELMELRQANRPASVEWLGRGSNRLNGLSVSGIGARRKSFADILQEGLHQPPTLSSPCSRPQSCNSIEPIIAASYPVEVCTKMVGSNDFYSRGDSPGLARVPNRCISAPIASSVSRNMSIEAKLTGMPCSPDFPLVDGRVSAGGLNIASGHSLNNSRVDDILAPFSDMNISRYGEAHEDRRLQSHLRMVLDNQLDNHHGLSNPRKPPGFGCSVDLTRKNDYVTGLGSSGISTISQAELPKRNASSASLYSELTVSGLETIEGYNDQFQLGTNILNTDLAGHHVHGGYPLDEELNSTLGGCFAAGLSQPNTINGEILHRVEHELGNELSYVHMQRSYSHAKHSLSNGNNISHMRNHFGSSPDITQLRKAYLEALMAQQKEQDSLRMGKLPSGMDQKHRGNLSFKLRSQYSGATPMTSQLPSVGYGGHVSHDERVARITSLMRSSMGEMTGSWPSNAGANAEGRSVSPVLDEFKNNKTRSFELADILGHVVEFSSDQYGSRFIQQKLETASEDEKKKIFPEILRHAHSLMSDVFGNYVMQKFFEHGSESQRKELAGQLTGHVLPLSLQMYGCRVIQKALEVVNVDQQTEMVAELDGSIMKCVRDQNGNHVIQKCIECVPQDRIQFMISAFYGQVVPLSMHPYGCRVIQRVLEYCDNPNTQEAVMEEIMQSVYTLAQDQYGNYVIQHVLEHGKPHERAAIISKLAGHIVKMSQQKFASNVVEKCLTFGSPEERKSVIQEMLGSTDENEPLQAMMKDPFGNYVVQKVLEICDDRTLEFILSRVKIHLNTLKRYTYGKHIVSRVEKLITTGERRIGLSTSLSSQ